MTERSPLSWPRGAGAAALAACGLLAACLLPDVDLEGRACPCADGYGCDVTTNTCVKGDATSAPASSGGSTSTNDVASASTSGGDASTGQGGDGGDPSGSSGGGEGGATSSASGGGEGGGGGGGGAGGAPGCPAGQTENVPMCTDFFDTFDDAAAFDDTWLLTGAASAFEVADSRLTLTMSTQTALLAVPDDVFDMVECGITVRLLTPPTGADVYARISIAPLGQQSRFGIGVTEGTLQTRQGDNVVAATGYDADVHRYLRIREEAGALVFGTSADGECWDEMHTLQTTDTVGITGRLGIVADAGPQPTFVEYDDYNYLPP